MIWLHLRFGLLAALVVVLGAAAPAAAAPAPPKVRVVQGTWHGWSEVYTVTNGTVGVSVVPAAGGRIMGLALGSDSIVFENPNLRGKHHPLWEPGASFGSWHNYGGIHWWPAPQDRWPGAGGPDPWIDGGRASVQVLPDGVRVWGAPSPVLGIQFVTELTMQAATGAITCRQTMRNVSGAPVTWSIWDVSTIRTPSFAVAPVNPRSPLAGGYREFGEGATATGQFIVDGGLVITEPQGKSAKIGWDSPSGWAVALSDRLAYVKRFPPLVEGAAYPDQGCTVEVYVNDRALPYIELEVLSPLFRLAPGEEASFTQEWRLMRLSRPVKTRADIAGALNELRAAKLLPDS